MESVKDSRPGGSIGSLTVASARPEQAASVLRGGFAKEVATRGDLLAIATKQRGVVEGAISAPFGPSTDV